MSEPDTKARVVSKSHHTMSLTTTLHTFLGRKVIRITTMPLFGSTAYLTTYAEGRLGDDPTDLTTYAEGRLGDDPTDLTQATFEYCRAYKFAERSLAFTHHESLVEQAVQRGAPHVR